MISLENDNDKFRLIMKSDGSSCARGTAAGHMFTEAEGGEKVRGLVGSTIALRRQMTDRPFSRCASTRFR